MIKRIELKNFQSHKSTVLEFSKGVNVIAGQSDSGKTAILRGLRWLFTNKPHGDHFRSHWGGDTEVTVEFEDGTVTRGRHKKSDNFYSWDKDDNPFKAFGANVPEPIVEFLNVLPINMQSQLDPPFLLSATPGDVAKYLNSIANLELIDTATFNINQKCTTADSNMKMHTGTLEDLEKELDRFKSLPELDKALQAVEHVESVINRAEDNSKILGNLIIHWGNLERDIKENELYVELDDIVSDMLDKKDALHTVTNIIGDLEDYNIRLKDINKYEAMEPIVKRGLELNETTEGLKYCLGMYHIVRRDINELEGEIEFEEMVESTMAYGDSYVEKKKTLEDFRKLLTSTQKIGDEILEVKELLLKQEETFHEEMPDECPLCGVDGRIVD